jgi:hypothetical protein
MEKAILVRIENQVRQQLLGAIMVLVLGAMFINSFTTASSQTSDNTNLYFNVTAGDFTIYDAPSNIIFAAKAYGTAATNINGNEDIDGLKIKDYRGGAADAWEVVCNSTGFDTTMAGNSLTLFAEAGTIYNVENAVVTNGTLNDAGTKLINGDVNADGIFQVDNSYLQLHYDGDEPAGTYSGLMTYTLA